jgi:DNA-directed RNA polymerase specialized sigma24 family protein
MGSVNALASALDALEERNALRSLEPWIQALAGSYLGTSHLVEDAKQIARIAIVQAIRTWDSEQGGRAAYVKQSARYALINFVKKEMGVQGGPFTGDGRVEREHTDEGAVNPERAVLILELYNALPPEQQAEVDRLLVNGHGAKGGQTRERVKLLRVVSAVLKALEAEAA